jgi:hypothetical protein
VCPRPKTRICLPTSLFNFALEYSIREAQQNQVGLKLGGTHHVRVYADDEILLGDNINTMKKKREALIKS